MKNLIGIVVVLFILGGCASGPKLNGPIKDIEAIALPQYWVEVLGRRGVSEVLINGPDLGCITLSKKTSSENQEYVVFSYVIDSSGRAYENKYISKSQGLDISDQYLSALAFGMSFPLHTPAKTNPEAGPVRLQYKMYASNCPSSTKI